ncbi:MAG: ATP-binding protein [Prevotellaceae bacterium]|jgi:hypothetical protein|nr:ATP-binding protein [Prevotellaceae bacterium]
MKNLPIGIQSFSGLREDNYLYVDKTEYVHRLISTGKVYFLSRPRRFGKSLLIGTLDALFSGKKDLFEGLFIYDKWDWTKKYPVVRIDWTCISHSSPETLRSSLLYTLKEIARNYQITLEASNPEDRFRELLVLLHRKTGERVVVLIDEYDKPITSHLYDAQLDEIKRAVHDFYQVIKGADDHLKFVFLTGVSKFSGLSVFSALNNLDDISLFPEYAGICGYTQAELESNFDDYIGLAAAKFRKTKQELLQSIRYWYDGYSWDGETFVYNPFSTLRFLKEKDFMAYWFGTGTPSFFIDIIKHSHRPETLFDTQIVDKKLLYDGYDPNAPETIPLMFQTGYLTVKGIKTVGEKTQYTLEAPNVEVSDATIGYLLKTFSTYPIGEFTKLQEIIRQQILSCDGAGLAASLKALFNVPYQIKGGKEENYHVLFQICLRALGFKVQSEVSTEFGRADAVLELPEMTAITEIKYSSSKSTETLLAEAKKQIVEKRYAEAYTGRIVLLCAAFTDEEVECRFEEYSR